MASLTQKVDKMLKEIKINKNEIQTIIHKELNFSCNSVNLLINQCGSNKTFKVFKELIKFSQLKKHCYTLFIYVNDSNNDSTCKKMKGLIKILTKIFPYAEADQVLNELIECKQAYDEIQEKYLQKELAEQQKDDILTNVFGTSGEGNFNVKFPQTIVLFVDAMSIFKNKNNPLFKKLFKNRQPRITYFLCLQEFISLDAAIKSNLDSFWFFGVFNRLKFNQFFFQSSILSDKETIWYEYVRLTKYQTLVVQIEISGTIVKII